MSSQAELEIQFSLRVRPRLTSDRMEPIRTPQAGRFPRVTQVLALAIHLEEMIRGGEAKDYADLARLSCLCRERLSQIVRLSYLAPDIQVELLYLPPALAGRYPITETAARKIANRLEPYSTAGIRLRLFRTERAISVTSRRTACSWAPTLPSVGP